MGLKYLRAGPLQHNRCFPVTVTTSKSHENSKFSGSDSVPLTVLCPSIGKHGENRKISICFNRQRQNPKIYRLVSMALESWTWRSDMALLGFRWRVKAVAANPLGQILSRRTIRKNLVSFIVYSEAYAISNCAINYIGVTQATSCTYAFGNSA